MILEFDLFLIILDLLTFKKVFKCIIIFLKKKLNMYCFVSVVKFVSMIAHEIKNFMNFYLSIQE